MGRSGDGKRIILLGRPYLRATPDSRTKNFYKAVPDNKKMAINSVWPILQFKLCLFNLNLSTKIACSSLRDSRVSTNMKIKWEETGENLFPAAAHFSQISRSYFRVPFPYASSLQSRAWRWKPVKQSISCLQMQIKPGVISFSWHVHK